MGSQSKQLHGISYIIPLIKGAFIAEGTLVTVIVAIGASAKTFLTGARSNVLIFSLVTNAKGQRVLFSLKVTPIMHTVVVRLFLLFFG